MQHLDHPFGEVRAAVADNLRHLSELRLHPSYSSVDVFMQECRESTGRLMSVDQEYLAQIDEFAAKLAAWREVRQSSAQGTQSYDKAALTSQSIFLFSIPIDGRIEVSIFSPHLDLVERLRFQDLYCVPVYHQAPTGVLSNAGDARQRCLSFFPLFSRSRRN